MKRTLLKRALLATSIVVLVATSLTLRATLTTAAVPACEAGKCPKTITVKSDGGTFSYKMGRRFNVILDSEKFPRETLSCAPEGIIAEFTNFKDRVTPNYVERYEAVGVGTCKLRDQDFEVTIVVTPTSTNATSSASSLVTAK